MMADPSDRSEDMASNLELVPRGDWRAYEAYIAGALAAHFPGVRFESNVSLPGLISRAPRQIDILAHADEHVAVECKYVGRKIDVQIVDSFVGKLLDVGIRRGVIITAAGFTRAAMRRAEADDLGVQLAIISPDRTSDYQHRGAPLIWRNATGVSLGLIDGWLCDAESSGEPGNALMIMYPLGHSRASAMSAAPFIYANFLSKLHPDISLDELAAPHQHDLASDQPGYQFEIERLSLADRSGVVRSTLLRRASGPAPVFGEEHALYIDYGEVVLLLVLCAPPNQSSRLRPQLIGLYEDSFTMTVDDRRFASPAIPDAPGSQSAGTRV